MHKSSIIAHVYTIFCVQNVTVLHDTPICTISGTIRLCTTPLSASLTSPLTGETYSQNFRYDSTSNKLSLSGRDAELARQRGYQSTSNKLSLSGRGACEAGGEGISFHYLCKSVINIASPNEKKRYFSSTAFLYVASIISRVASVLTSISSVLCGRWKFVTSSSTKRNL